MPHKISRHRVTVGDDGHDRDNSRLLESSHQALSTVTGTENRLNPFVNLTI